MNTSGEAAEQVVRLTMEGVEVTGKLIGGAAKHIALMLLAAFKNPKSKVEGKVGLARMLREHPTAKFFTMRGEDFERFKKEAGKNGILYHAIKRKDGTIDIVVPEECVERLNRFLEYIKINAVKQDATYKKTGEREEKERGSDERSKKKEGEILKPEAKINESENPNATRTDSKPAAGKFERREPALELIIPVRTLVQTEVSREKADDETEKIEYANGTVYEGEVKHGVPNGKGTVTFTEGYVYEGEIANGEINGYGCMTSPEGYIYEGEFRNGNFDGHGQITCPTGETFAVESQDGHVFNCRAEAPTEQKETQNNLLPPVRDENEKPSVHKKLEKNKEIIVRRKQERNQAEHAVSKTAPGNFKRRGKPHKKPNKKPAVR